MKLCSNESLLHLHILTLAEDDCNSRSNTDMLCKLASIPGKACVTVRVSEGW